MAAQRELVLKITVDEAGSTATVQRFNDTLKANEGIADAVAAAEKRLDAEFAKTEKTVESLEKQTGKLSQSQQHATTTQDSLTAAIGRYVTAGAILGAINHTMDYADAVQDAAERTRMSVEQFQLADHAARRFGETGDTVARLVTAMTERIGGGESSAVGALQRLGLSMDDLKRQSPYETFVQIGAAVRQLPDAYTQAATAQDLFGRSGKENIPLLTADLKGLADQARATGQVIDDDTVKALADADQAIEDAVRSGKVLLGEVLGPMAPLARELATAISELSQAMRQIPSLPIVPSGVTESAGVERDTGMRSLLASAVYQIPGVGPKLAAQMVQDDYSAAMDPGAGPDVQGPGLSMHASTPALPNLPQPGESKLLELADVSLLKTSRQFSPWTTGLDNNGTLAPWTGPTDPLRTTDVAQSLADLDETERQERVAADEVQWAADMEAMAAQAEAARTGVAGLNAEVRAGRDSWREFAAAARTALKVATPQAFSFGADAYEQSLMGQGAGANLGGFSDVAQLSSEVSRAQFERMGGVAESDRRVITSRDYEGGFLPGSRGGGGGASTVVNIDAKQSLFESDASLGVLADRVSRQLAMRMNATAKVR